MRDDVLKKRINEFEETLEEQLNDENFQSKETDVDFYLEDVEIAEDDPNAPTDGEYGDMIQEKKKDVNEFDNNAYGWYLGAELSINRGDGEIRGGAASFLLQTVILVWGRRKLVPC
jgi:hypothetical protein